VASELVIAIEIFVTSGVTRSEIVVNGKVSLIAIFLNPVEVSIKAFDLSPPVKSSKYPLKFLAPAIESVGQ